MLAARDRAKRRDREKFIGGKGMETRALMAMSPTQMIERAQKAKFPRDLTVRDWQNLAEVAICYGLDPLMGELTVLFGNVYIEISGRRRKAQETNELAGTSDPTPLRSAFFLAE
jgi:hypothetical protein